MAENENQTDTSKNLHRFDHKNFIVPSTCYVCDEMIWGKGFECLKCGTSIHRFCIKSVSENCNPSPSPHDIAEHHPSTNTTTPHLNCESLSMTSSLSKFRFQHCWVPETLPLSVFCFVCELPIALSLDVFNGYECVRCGQTVHIDCANSSTICEPRHKNLIFIPQLDIFTQSSSVSSFASNSNNNNQSVLQKGRDNEQNSIISSSQRMPLLVLINPRSGAQLGSELKQRFSNLLSPEQVFVIDPDKGPLDILQKFQDVKNLRILVCGGDGTVGWVMNCIDTLTFSSPPPVCVLPLGTGNDLAQTFKWGARYDGEDLSLILNDIEKGIPSKLDRWKVTITPQKNTNQKTLTSAKTVIMNNYLSVGVDAQVALGFHQLRKENPELCTSVWLNKFWYATYGIKAFFTGVENLENIVTLIVDGYVTKLPEGTEGIIVLNLPSYSGGVNIWGDHLEEKFRPQSVEDKLLEVAGVTSVYHLGQMQVNMNSAIRFAQGRSVKLIINVAEHVPMQFRLTGSHCFKLVVRFVLNIIIKL